MQSKTQARSGYALRQNLRELNSYFNNLREEMRRTIRARGVRMDFENRFKRPLVYMNSLRDYHRSKNGEFDREEQKNYNYAKQVIFIMLENI